MPHSIFSEQPILGLAFRPLFLLAGLWALLCVVLWWATLNGLLQFNPYGGSMFWHGHEMLFGFIGAVVVGFLLTAVQNWTGIRGLHGAKLAALVAVWLAGRSAMFTNTAPLVTAVIDCLFLPLATLFLAQPILKAKQARNLMFVPLLTAMTCANIVAHIGIHKSQLALATQGLYAMGWLVLVIMTVIGGRILPMFTANGTQTQRVADAPYLERMTLALTVAVATLHATGAVNYLTDLFNTVLLLITGLIYGWRVVRWRFWITGKTPLLWSLHLAFLYIPLMLLLLSLHYGQRLIDSTPSLTYSTAVHLLFVGAMANMVLSMMARVSLGHTGRPLQPPQLMTAAFVAIAIAALTRTLLVWWAPLYFTTWLNITSLLWVTAFGIFCMCYWPVLTQSRRDGKPG